MTDKLTPAQITALKEAAEKYNAANAELAKSHLEGTHTPEKTKAMIKAFDGFHDACDSEVIADLLAEREALREALKAIDAMPYYTPPIPENYVEGLLARYTKALDTARKALGE